MDDLISRQAAIDEMEQAKEQYFDRRVIIGKMQDIVNNLPSEQPDVPDIYVGGMISRQAAIDAIAELQGRASTKAELKGISKAWKRIKQLPSAQPEIVRCKDCRWSGVNEIGDLSECNHVRGLVNASPNGYCNFAERRTDE